MWFAAGCPLGEQCQLSLVAGKLVEHEGGVVHPQDSALSCTCFVRVDQNLFSGQFDSADDGSRRIGQRVKRLDARVQTALTQDERRVNRERFPDFDDAHITVAEASIILQEVPRQQRFRSRFEAHGYTTSFTPNRRSFLMAAGSEGGTRQQATHLSSPLKMGNGLPQTGHGPTGR